MIRTDLETAYLIVKELTGELSENEKSVLEQWKHDNPELYSRLTDPARLRQQAELVRNFPIDKGWRRVQSRIRRTSLLRYVALLALPVAVSIAVIMYRGRSADAVISQNIVKTTSKGEISTLILEDGTAVHLNSMSRFQYPEAFSDDQRTVFLDGEAYLEVAKAGTPFVVKTDRMDIEVTGTAFDVSAYPGETATATLVSGSVKVSVPDGPSVILQPSQQASLSDGMELTVRNIDTETCTSWTEGKIVFRDERLEDILDRLSRWYDFSARYQDDTVKDMRFGCHADRNEELDSFMALLRQTNRIKITKNGSEYYFHNQ